jgi:thioredoxin reductase (NADPH)
MSASQSPPPNDPPPWAKGTAGREDEIFPKLSSEEIEIVRGYGEEQHFDHGTKLWEVGADSVPLYLVLEGEIEVLRYDEDGEHITTTYGPGQYSGELGCQAPGRYIAHRRCSRPKN